MAILGVAGWLHDTGRSRKTVSLKGDDTSSSTCRSGRFHQSASGSDLGRARHLLAASVGQVVEVDRLAVPVDPGRDDPEAVEAGAGLPRALAQVEADGLPVQRQGDPAPAAGRRGSNSPGSSRGASRRDRCGAARCPRRSPWPPPLPR